MLTMNVIDLRILKETGTSLSLKRYGRRRIERLAERRRRRRRNASRAHPCLKGVNARQNGCDRKATVHRSSNVEACLRESS
jgi:hypothetical protein